MASFKDSFLGRVRALSRTQTLLACHKWSEIPVNVLVELEIAEAAMLEGRVRIEGPDVALPSDAGLGLGLALHELRRNAEKFGALSVTQGRVDVSWRMVNTKEGRRFELNWVETEGPGITPPTRAGLGMHLLQKTLARQLGGTIVLEFPPTGLIARLTANA